MVKEQLSWGLIPFISEVEPDSNLALVEVIDTGTGKPITSLMASFLELRYANFDLLSHEVGREVMRLFNKPRYCFDE